MKDADCNSADRNWLNSLAGFGICAEAGQNGVEKSVAAIEATSQLLARAFVR